jgi:threonine dehydrogenase-like Zn-dependent dehydrogenase
VHDKTFKAVQYAKACSWEVVNVPVPPVGVRDVRIKVHQVGVCGTDLHLHRGTYMGVYPQVFSVDGRDPDTAVFTEPTARPSWAGNARHASRRQRTGHRRWPDRSLTCTTYCQRRRYFSHRCRHCRLQAPHCLCPRY